MAIADDDVARRLAMLGDMSDAEMDQRMARFQGLLQELREDPAETARIEALVAETEREEQHSGAASTSGLTFYVNGGVVNVSHGKSGQVAETAFGEDTPEPLPVLQPQEPRSARDLEPTGKHAPSPARPRRLWKIALAPALGGGMLVAILAAATATIALHVTVAGMTVIASVFAAATVAAAIVSLWAPWASVRQLNRQGDAHIALELLLSGSTREKESGRDREARWVREDQESERDWQHSQLAFERSQLDLERREAAHHRRAELEASLELVRTLVERGLADHYSLEDLLMVIRGESRPVHTLTSGTRPLTRGDLPVKDPDPGDEGVL